MKYLITLLITCVLTVTSIKSSASSAATFTKVTTGPLVTDLAHSFGCAWGDYDEDGYLDLIVGNGLGDANALYHNEGNGTFVRITTGAIPTTIGDTDGCTWADYDNDGDLDLFVANWQLGSFLFRNDGAGNFTRVLTAGILTTPANSNGCAWGDYDNDGFLDLVVANSNGQNEHLYRNKGDGTFVRIVAGPLVTSGASSFAPTWVDYDNDGGLDLLVSLAGTNTDSLSLLFHSEGQGAFTQVLDGVIIAKESSGTDWGDYDNDGDLDLVGVSWAGGVEANAVVFRNDTAGTFTSITLATLATHETVPGPAIWGDYDNDGWLDIFYATHSVPGHPEDGQKDLLFHNNGDGTFTRVTEGQIVNDLAISQAAAWADYDNDGFLDLFVANGHEPLQQANFLFHNDGNNNHWLSIRCIGTVSNRSAIGAKVRVRSSLGGVVRWQLRQINSGNGFSGSGLRAHFGLDDATRVDLLRIEWPSGIVQELRDVSVDQILTVREPPMFTHLLLDGTGAFQLALRGGLGVVYTIEYSTDLFEWHTLKSVTPTNVWTAVTDLDSSSTAGQRFYRAWEGD